ncbi:MAG: hypothetical protein K0S23_1406 [Fluviicola sp.]|jgi:hypothetical protein|uniref:OmpA family protein n=1 Tax=Fluviicola sp. TaxID=1917219 RepID=UPI00260AD459|nr:OmpA family protein [Fluviicola sp.]MDF3027099.1 hypothetical protein [Fluviicola sp.]
MKKLISVSLIFVFIHFTGKSQGTFTFSDTVVVAGQQRELTDIRFAICNHSPLIYDSTNINELDSLIDFLQKNRQISIEIGVHTDSRGSDSMNLKISQMRADSVREYLTKRGVENSRMLAKGYGETQCLVSEEEINRYKKTNKAQYNKLHIANRRTVITIIP